MNVITIGGRLGLSPELKFSPSGAPVLRISVATNTTWNDKTTGEKMQRTEWHYCTAWGKTAELISQYFNKGDFILLSGEMRYSMYTDAQGIERRGAEINIDRFYFTGASSNNQQGGQWQQQPQQGGQWQQQPQQGGQWQQQPQQGGQWQQQPQQGGQWQQQPQQGGQNYPKSINQKKQEAAQAQQAGGFDKNDGDIPF